MKVPAQIKPADYRKLPDEELVRHYKELHEYPAYNILFERFGHTVFGMCLDLKVGDIATAKAKTEEVFISMSSDIKPMKTGSFKSWLYNYVIYAVTGQKNAVNEQSTGEFDSSACLARRQMSEYVNGQTEVEENHAIEHHLAHCPLCSMAVHGMKAYGPDAVAALADLNNRFLHDHFSISYPQVHVSSLVADGTSYRRVKAGRASSSIWVHILLGLIVTAAVVMVVFVGKDKGSFPAGIFK